MEIQKLPKQIKKGDIIAGLNISYKPSIEKWIFSYGRLSAKQAYLEDNIHRVGIGETIEFAYADFMERMKNYKNYQKQIKNKNMELETKKPETDYKITDIENILDKISEHAVLIRTTTGYKMICPVCSDKGNKTAGLYLNTKREQYHCFSCGQSGTLEGLENDLLAFSMIYK